MEVLTWANPTESVSRHLHTHILMALLLQLSWERPGTPWDPCCLQTEMSSGHRRQREWGVSREVPGEGTEGRGWKDLMARGRGSGEHTQAPAPELPRPGCMLDLSLHHPLSILGINYPIAPGRSWELEGGRRRSAEACRVGEAVFDAKYQQNPQKMDCDILTFPTAFTASELTSDRRKLGCDKFINRA